MLHAAIQLLLYALLAGLSPIAFAAAIAVMPAGRLKTIGFGIAFVLAQLLTCSLLVIIGVAATGPNRNSHPDLHAGLELMAAAVLVWLAAQAHRKPAAARERSSPRTRKLLERLGRLRFVTTLLAGLLLGIGGPKRLVVTALAATTISTAGLHDSGEAALVVLYAAIASVLVWGPVILFVFLGDRTVALLKTAQQEVARHQPHVTVYALLLIAALLTLDAIRVLL
jgi:threonine/homoserine/homoserine lactone efflux protein